VVDAALEGLLNRRRAVLSDRIAELLPELRHPDADGLGGSHRDRHAIHQFRTSLRRLRSMAEAFPRHWPGPPARKLGRLARRAGRVRDLDVLLGQLESRLEEAGGGERRRLGHALALLAGRRRRLRNKLARRLRRGPRWLQRMVAEPSDAAEPDRQHLALPLLQAALLQQLGQIRLEPGWSVDRRPPAGSAEENDIHSLRKAFKRLRYQLELWEVVAPDLRDRLVQLKAVQDALGCLQDFVIWEALLAGTGRRPLPRRFPGLHEGWRRQRQEAWSSWCRQRHVWLETAAGFPGWQLWVLETPSPEAP
jgi:CHAD domain-containing protein